MNEIYIVIKLIHATHKKLLFTYSAPNNNNYNKGDFVFVSIQKRFSWAIIHSITNKKPSFETKKILFHLSISNDFHNFLKTVSYFYRYDETFLYKKIYTILSASKKNSIKNSDEITIVNNEKTITLSDHQKNAYDKIIYSIETKKTKPILLYGLTGSGKTHIYTALIQLYYTKKKTIIYLVPDVTLAQNSILTLKKYLGDDFPIFSIHSATEKHERTKTINALLCNIPCVIIGVHLPIYLPIKNLGIIIIDEEHDTGFIEQSYPFFNNKEIALIRSSIEKVPIILGSATPSIASLYNAENNTYTNVQLTQRYHQTTLPKITNIVLKPLREEPRENFWISNYLYNEIKMTLENNNQVLLFLNRKGLYSFAQCKQCNYAFSCSQCSILYTIYEHNKMQCNKCFETTTVPENCFKCKSPHKTIEYKGIGGQLLKKITVELFPTKTIELADLSTMKDKKLWKHTVEKMIHKKIDILIGTQLIARGYHFPGVTLVGVIWADMMINVSGFSITEQTIQMLIQVSGRAGREGEEGSVIIQHVNDVNDLLQHATEHDYYQIYTSEIEFRKKYLHPPCIKMGLIIISGEEEETQTTAMEIYYTLKNNSEIFVNYPIKPPIYKIKKKYYWYIYIKSEKFQTIITAVNQLNTTTSAKIVFVPNPQLSYYF